MAITGIMVVKRSSKHINESLNSLKQLAEEILIADIGMSDELKIQLSSSASVKVIPFPPVPYVELIREKLKKMASNEYVLFLDPDEVLPPSLIEILRAGYAKYDYISIPRKNIIFGKWIQNSRWWPDYQIRLFKKNAVIWPTEIHHQPEAKGTELKLEQKEELAIIHHNYESIDEYLEKAIRYAKAQANEKIQSGQEYRLNSAVKDGLSEFISRYFAAKGYKDGMHGFVLSFLQMFYGFLVYFYYWEYKKYAVKNEEPTKEVKTFFAKGLYETIYWTPKKIIDRIISRLVKKLN